jgi:uncharacterized membrane protein
MTWDEARTQGRREAAPAALLLSLLYIGLAAVSWAQGWELLDLHWWVWLTVAGPALLLTLDLLLALGGQGLVQSRDAAVTLLALLVLANLAAVSILVVGLVSTSTKELTGAELLVTGAALWSANVIVFGLLFWEIDAGGPAHRMRDTSRTNPDLRFPQDEDSDNPWRPVVWDYLYVSLTNSIAFSPTDTMPMTLRAKTTMGLGSVVAAFTVLLVLARAVNVIGN